MTPAMVIPSINAIVTSLRIIPEFQVSGGGDKEIPNHFVVYFHVVDDNVVVIVCIFFDKFEDVLDGEHAG